MIAQTIIKKNLSLLSEYNFKKIYFFLIGILFLSFLEMISIGLLLPLISSIITNNTSEIFLYDQVREYFGIKNIKEYVIFFSIIISLIFIIKFIFSTSVVIYSNNILMDIKLYISKKLLSRYLNQSYTWHSYNNKSDFMHLLINETNTYTLNALNAFFNLIIDLSILVAIIFILFFINTKLFIYIFFLSIIIIFIINKYSKKFNYRYGAQRTKQANIIMKHLNESLSGIKEIILYSSGKLVSKIFLESTLKMNKSLAKNLNSQEIFRYSIELIGVFLILTILTKVSFDPNVSKVKSMETLGIYIVALFKLLPMFNRISTQTQRFRNGQISAEKINLFLDTTKPTIELKNNINFNQTIELKNIKYKYPGQKNLILNNINLKIKKNEIVAIVGKSGEGKTTITNILMGLLKPDSGNIFIDGKDMIKNNLSISHETSFLSQGFYSIDGNIPDNITLSNQKINFSNLRYALRNSLLNKDIINKKLSLKMQLGDSVKKLSGGQLQKINLARALYRKPKFLIMDEPTSAIDIQGQKDLNKIILRLKKNMTIVVISHNYEFLTNFDKVYELKNNNLELIKNIK